MGKHSTEPVQVKMMIKGKWLDMEVDADTALSLISDAKRKAIFPNEELRPTNNYYFKDLYQRTN